MLAVALTVALHAAPLDYDSVRVNGNNAGLIALGVWGVAGALTGAIGLAAARDPEWKGAHLANLLWGVVNIGFAVFGLTQGLLAAQTPGTLEQSHSDGRNTQLIYSVNAGLDVGYIAAAALLLNHVHGPFAKGFAKASLIQALWLTSFDSSMALFHQLNNQR